MRVPASFAAGVRMWGLRPEASVLYTIALLTAYDMGWRLRTNSCVDRGHSEYSGHYDGRAWDWWLVPMADGDPEPTVEDQKDFHKRVDFACSGLVDVQLFWEADHTHGQVRNRRQMLMDPNQIRGLVTAYTAGLSASRREQLITALVEARHRSG